MFSSLWTTVTGDEKYDLQDKRVTVLQLTIEELNKQAQEQKKELGAAKATIRDYEAKAKAHAPMERKLFAKLETTQLELRKAREAKRRAELAAQSQADELTAALASNRGAGSPAAPADAAASATDGGAPPSALLLRTNTAQLDSTKALLRDAEAAAEGLELCVSQAEAALRRAEEAAAQSEQRAAAAEATLVAQIARAAANSDLVREPPADPPPPPPPPRGQQENTTTVCLL